MTEQEIERVAELLAKVGGTWFPERASLAFKPVTSRQRDVARLILAELDRTKAAQQTATVATSSPEEANARSSMDESQLSVGAMVEYCPPGDKRTIACRIERLDQDRAYLVSVGREVGWVSTHTFLPLKP